MVKKRILAMSLVLVMLLCTVVQAAGPMKAPLATPTLSFSGTTATCTANVRGNNASDRLSVTMKLWNGNTCLKTWTASGTGNLRMSKTATVSKGKTYKMTVDYTVNGVKQTQQFATGTCR